MATLNELLGLAAKPPAPEAPERVAPVVVPIRSAQKCGECGRVFDMLNEQDADEWSSGHDCEPPELRASYMGVIDLGRPVPVSTDEQPTTDPEDEDSTELKGEYGGDDVETTAAHDEALEQKATPDTVEVTLDRKELAHALLNLNRVCGGRTALPVLAHVHLTAGAGLVTMVGTDLDITAQVRLSASVHGEGTVLIPVAVFKQTVAASKAQVVRITFADGSGEVRVDGTLMRTGVVADFPKLTMPMALNRMVQLGPNSWDTLQRVTVAASTDQARPLLTGVSVDSEDGRLRFVCTDSYRLAVGDTDVPYADGTGVVLPARAVKLWSQLWGAKQLAQNITTAFGFDPRAKGATPEVFFQRGNWQLWARTIEGTFPNYRTLLPANPPTVIRFEAEQMLGQVKQAAAVAKDHIPVRFTIQEDPDGTLVSATRQDVGGYAGHLPTVKVRGEGMTIAFNTTYLADGVEAVGPGWLEMGLIDPFKPAAITRPGGPKVTYLLMPVRL